MAKNNNKKSGGFLSFAVFILFLVVGLSFYLNGQTLSRLENVEKSYQSVVSRMAEMEMRGVTQSNSESVKVSNTAPSKLSENMGDILIRTKFNIDNQIFCSEGEETKSGDILNYEVLYFNKGILSFYNVKKYTAITPKMLAEGQGKYTLKDLDILATVTMSEGGTQIHNFKISELSKNQREIFAISLSSETTWTKKDCDRFGITSKLK